MKKSLIVIALALLMIVPMFAASTEPVSITTKDEYLDLQNNEAPLSNAINEGKNVTSTDVTLTLKLKPIYYAAITSKSGKNIDKTNYEEDDYKNVKEISMVVNDDLILQSNSENFLSYFFYQNSQSVTLTVSIDKDLTTEDKRTAADKVASSGVKYTISYYVDFYDIDEYTNAQANTSAELTPKYTIHSNIDNGSTSRIIAQRDGSMRLDNSVTESYKIVISPEETSKDLSKNIAGAYKSTITLKLTNA